VRATLNLGHTFGHAIEASMGYGQWLHGEAVAAGMVMACEMSVRLGWLDESVTKRTEKLLARASLPVSCLRPIWIAVAHCSLEMAAEDAMPQLRSFNAYAARVERLSARYPHFC